MLDDGLFFINVRLAGERCVVQTTPARGNADVQEPWLVPGGWEGGFMSHDRRKFWIGVAVGLLGVTVGVSNLVRGLGVGVTSRHSIIGAVCVVLALGWLAYLFVSSTRHGPRHG